MLDPHLTQDAFITGLNILPGQPDVVHHVILFRVPPASVPAAEAKDAAEHGRGLDLLRRHRPARRSGGARRRALAGRLGAGRLGAGDGQGRRRAAGEGLAGDHAGALQPARRTAARTSPRPSCGSRRRPADLAAARDDAAARAGRAALPRRAHDQSPLCDRATAVADVSKRFGDEVGQTANYLHLLCGQVQAGPGADLRPDDQRAGDDPRRPPGTCTCSAGRSRSRSTPAPRRRGPSWTSRSGTSTTRAPSRSSRCTLQPGDTVRVTCRHDQSLRDLLPAFKGQPERYVVWGEGTTDEMCLGILLVTRP